MTPILAIDPGTERKVCSKCGTEHPLGWFYRNPLTRDGRGSWCIDCERSRDRKEYVRASRGTERYRLVQERYRNSAKGKAAISAYTRLAAKKWPAKVRARWAVKSAIKAGRLVRPGTCDDCGSAAKVHAHHEDYAQPLVVAWVCPKCHARRDGRGT